MIDRLGICFETIIIELKISVLPVTSIGGAGGKGPPSGGGGAGGRDTKLRIGP